MTENIYEAPKSPRSFGKLARFAMLPLVVLMGFAVTWAWVAAAAPEKAGDLDLTFSEDGLDIPSFDDPNGFNEFRGVVVQDDGKIVAAGSAQKPGMTNQFQFALARYNTDGSLDTTFNTDGVLTDVINVNDTIFDVALDENWNIVVAGRSSIPASPNGTFVIARYKTDGSRDNTFSTDGVLTVPIGTDSQANSVAIQDDGKIVVGGLSASAGGATGIDFALARVNPNGSLDDSFNTDGVLTTPIGINDDQIRKITIQDDGKIVAVGDSQDNFFNDVFAVARYNTDGSLDNTFDTTGVLTTPIDTTAQAFDVKMDADGKIVVGGFAGQGFPPINTFAIARYNANGSPDTTFDTTGVLTVPVGVNSVGYALDIQDDGKILVGGTVADPSDMLVKAALLRLNSDGQIDDTFGDSGTVSTAIGTQFDVFFDITLEPNGGVEGAASGKILAVGTSFNNGFVGGGAVIARYLNGDGGPPPDQDKFIYLPIMNR